MTPFEQIAHDLSIKETPNELTIDSLDAWLKERISFHLTYARDETRHFNAGGLDGRQIPNAYWAEDRKGINPKNAPGEWCHDEFWRECVTEKETVRAALRVAISEVVHEALEWFHVDGHVFIDPHGDDEDLIIRMSVDFADTIFALAGDKEIEET